jgi:HlyD family secretion protein
VSGNIARILVDHNSRVKEGQVLAELETLPFQTRVQQNQANYLSAVASLEKAKVTLDNLKAKYERALNLAEKNLISSEEMEAGQTVQASFTAPKIFEIANDLSQMQVECDVDEADIGKIKEKQKVRFTVDAFPDEVFSGVVRQVRYSPTVNQNVVTYATIIDFDNPGEKLRPGMTAAVSIITGESKGALCIPNAALRFTPDLPAEEIARIMKEAAGERMLAKDLAKGRQGTSVSSGSQLKAVWYLDDKGKPSVALLRPGITDNAFTEILAGDFKEGHKVITGIGTGSSSGSRAADQGPPNPAMFGAPPPPGSPPPPPPGK